MNFEQKKQLCAALQALAFPGTVPNDAKKYAAFGIMKGDQFRLAVTVERVGATVFTERIELLEELASRGIRYRPYGTRNRDKRRYSLPDLTIEHLTEDEVVKKVFVELVEDSISMKKSGL